MTAPIWMDGVSLGAGGAAGVCAETGMPMRVMARAAPACSRKTPVNVVARNPPPRPKGLRRVCLKVTGGYIAGNSRVLRPCKFLTLGHHAEEDQDELEDED